MHIQKLIILIGPPVFCMEIYGDLFSAIKIQEPETLALQKAHLYDALIGWEFCCAEHGAATQL